MLLDDYMVEHAANREERIAGLSESIELLRLTYYSVLPMMRMEMAERAAADKGEPLTAEGLTKLECNELRDFFGAERGITAVDPGACLTWTIMQQPYDDLYFYKYLTAVSAAAYFADGIEHGDNRLRERYFTLLKAGGSEDPYALLKRVGFDARDPTAYSAIGHRLERDVDALERELRAAGRLGASSPATGRKRKSHAQRFFVRIFAFAGLWDCWRSPNGQAMETCTILTTTPNDMLADVHDRMPVIPGSRALWSLAHFNRIRTGFSNRLRSTTLNCKTQGAKKILTRNDCNEPTLNRSSFGRNTRNS